MIEERAKSEEGSVSDCWQVRLTVGHLLAPGIARSDKDT